MTDAQRSAEFMALVTDDDKKASLTVRIMSKKYKGNKWAFRNSLVSSECKRIEDDYATHMSKSVEELKAILKKMCPYLT